jgi:hypothetical protein
MIKTYHFKGDKLLIASDPSVEIPIAKIFTAKLENDATGPCVAITTVSGVVVRFWVDSSQKEKIMELIQNKRAETLKRELETV